MFSGIVESVQPILTSIQGHGSLVRVKIKKPLSFNDLKIGDSVATDGICLTVEAFDLETMTFALAAETLKILKWPAENPQKLVGKKVNLERSLRLGDRIHGHLVTGHVDSLGTVIKAESPTNQIQKNNMENLLLEIQVSSSVLPFVWNKSSITLNGVSLTVNRVQGSIISVGLIPETLKQTNLGELKAGDIVNVEPDYMAKALCRMFEMQKLKELSV